jgi:hypothetical protein
MERGGHKHEQGFWVVQLDIDEAIRALDNRRRNQFIGCMHAHNELVVLNRLFIFSCNPVGEGEPLGELMDSAESVQMWCLPQVLTGKLYETWMMLIKRFLSAQPEDPALAALVPQHRASFDWLKEYFGDSEAALKQAPLRIIRDKTALHYDKLNLVETVQNLGPRENAIYLAQHPANALYYLGSATVFRASFALIADRSEDTSTLTHGERVTRGSSIAIEDAKHANYHMHLLLNGLIESLLEQTIGKPLEAVSPVRKIPIQGPRHREAAAVHRHWLTERARKTSGHPRAWRTCARTGVRAVIATCQACGYKADVNVDALPETIFVPETGRRLRCSQCGGKRINTRPASGSRKTNARAA